MGSNRLPTQDEPLDLGAPGPVPSESTKDETLSFAKAAPRLDGTRSERQVKLGGRVESSVEITAPDPPAADNLRSGPVSDRPPRTEDLMVGTVLDGRYEIQEVIGRGAMGVVYRARQAAADREVAVKVLIPEVSRKEKSLKRFANEAKIISRLRHPNTLRLFDCRTDRGGIMYIVTELLHGISLGALIHKKGALPVEQTLRIAEQVAASLAEAHDVGIIHRDVKPDNVFLERVGDEYVVKVLDFGIAKLLDEKSALTTFGTLVGTPAYVSPEQAMGRELDARSDLYALGVLLHHMLAGVPPFKAASAAETIAMHLHTPIPKILRPALLDKVPASLEQLVFELLSKSPAARPASASEVRERIRHVAPDEPLQAPVPDPAEPGEKEQRIFGRITSVVGRFVSKPGSGST